MNANFPLLALTLLLSASGARAREAILMQFGDGLETPLPYAKVLNHPTSSALRLYLEAIVRSDFEPIQRASSLVPGPSPEQENTSLHSPLSLGAFQPKCGIAAYAPTWWLPREVEMRRSMYFGSMANVACEFDVPVALLDAVIAQESGYKAWALSGAGAMGMMQVMPGTAKILELRNPWDALANMRAGARYLRQQLDRFERVDLALAAYNAGPERRSLALGSIPAIPETRNYVQAITTNWVRLTKLGSPDSAVAARAMAANIAVRASGYREVSLITYEGTNAANPI